MNMEKPRTSSCSVDFQQFDGMDAGESPNCATDGASRAVASRRVTSIQNILEVLGFGSLNKKNLICAFASRNLKNPL